MADLKAQLELTADASGVEAGVGKAKKSLATLGDTATRTSKRASDSIDRYVRGLEVQNIAQSKSAREAKLYELGLKGASRAQLDSADALLRVNERYENHANIMQKARLAAAAAATVITAAGIAALKNSIQLLDSLDEISEKVGITVEKLSALRYAGEVSGTPFEALTSGVTRLSKLMAEVAGGNKEAIATFKALDVQVRNTDGTLRDSDSVLSDLADRFAGYEDGAAKAALAQRVFGKSGAEMIPILNQGASGMATLSDEARKLGAIYSGSLAKDAAQFNDNLEKLKIAAEAGAVSISGPLISSMARLSEEFVASAKQGGFWAASMKTYWKGVKEFWSGDLFNGGGAADKALAALTPDDMNDAVYRKFQRPRTRVAAPVVEDEPKGAKSPKAAKDNSAALEAKARLSSDLEAIKNQREALTNTIDNSEKILEAMRSASLVSESDYYGEKLALMQRNTAAEVDALTAQKMRVEQEKVTGKDAIDAAKQIAGIEAEIAKVRENSATSVKVLSIQQVAAYQRIADAILDAKAAAQSYLDTTSNAYNRELAGVGKGNQARARETLRNGTDDRYESQRQDLASELRRGDITRAVYEQQLDIVNEFHGKALDADEKYWQRKLELQKDWKAGALEALSNYYDESQNIAKHTEEAVGNALKGLEDQLANLASGKKFDAKGLFASISAELTRNAVKETITGPLANVLKGFVGGKAGGLLDSVTGPKAGIAALGTSATAGATAIDQLALAASNAAGSLGGAGATGGSGGGGIWGSLLGAAASAFMPAGGFSNSTAIGLANASGGGLDDFFKYTNNFAGRAIGGPVSAGGIYQVNERGPELLQIGNKQLLMMGGQPGHVSPMASGGGGGQQVVNNFTINGPIDRRTQQQIAAAAGRSIRTATTRQG